MRIGLRCPQGKLPTETISGVREGLPLVPPYQLQPRIRSSGTGLRPVRTRGVITDADKNFGRSSLSRRGAVATGHKDRPPIPLMNSFDQPQERY
jgi:hypothetical protein